jgi:predicted pyridoxine 5'-phosphate oxidase superfamily flavin-nucleotide-binding protein
MSFYHEGQRALQDAFDSRRIADRLEQVTLHERLHEGDRDFIGRCAMFFLATVDDEGRPDVSYKGGYPGFLQILSDIELAFPHYDGNGMFRSMGNVLVHPEVALLFVDFERPDRLRIHGRAEVVLDEPLIAQWPGAQAAVRVRIDRVFPNCPRYIHRMALQHPSPYVPREGTAPPEPEWKQMEVFRDALPGRGPEGEISS